LACWSGQVLAELQDRLPAFPTEDALVVIQTELGVGSAFDAFSELDPTPVAAASLGQVRGKITQFSPA